MELKPFEYSDANLSQAHGYIIPEIKRILDERSWPENACALDYGCGSGAFANWLGKQGFSITGFEPSESGIALAKKNYPDHRFICGSTDKDLDVLGEFDLVTCIEVIAHCYDPHDISAKIYRRLKPGGIVIISTPYHGYIKNLVLAIMGYGDKHYNPLSLRSHIKFFSIPTMTTLLKDTGFENIHFSRVGRIPALAKSMIVVASKPDGH